MIKLLVVGLGNPDRIYLDTPHNAGFLVIDSLAKLTSVRLRKTFLHPWLYAGARIGRNELYLVKPLTYMNRSGQILPALFRKTRTDISNLLVVCDTLDLDPGKIRLRRKGGTAGHNGLKSVRAFTESDDYMRFYIGIGRPERREDVKNYVLSPFSDERRSIFQDAAERSARAILKLFEKPLDEVINEANS